MKREFGFLSLIISVAMVFTLFNSIVLADNKGKGNLPASASPITSPTPAVTASPGASGTASASPTLKPTATPVQKGSSAWAHAKKYAEDPKAIALKIQLKKYYCEKMLRKQYLNQLREMRKKYSETSSVIALYINGNESGNSFPPTIKSGKLLIPLNPILKALGATYTWDNATKTLTVTRGTTVIVLVQGSSTVTVNGAPVKLDALPQFTNKGTLVPISLLMKILKCNCEYDTNKKWVTVDNIRMATINDNTAGTGSFKFNYSGTWSYGAQQGAYCNDNHWSAAKDSYAALSFSGTKIILYGAKNNTHGIAMVSIDGGTETAVDYYAATRSDNVAVYTSPVLTNKQHTLKVRVTATGNTASTGVTVTIDRADVIQ